MSQINFTIEAGLVLSQYKNNARVVRNLEERNVGTKGKSPKQNLASAKDLTIELPETPYHRLD